MSGMSFTLFFEDWNTHSEKRVGLRPTAGEASILAFRFSPDEVQTALGRDYEAQMLMGGLGWLENVRARRTERRFLFQRIAGDLGLHVLREVEEAEGWFGVREQVGDW